MGRKPVTRGFHQVFIGGGKSGARGINLERRVFMARTVEELGEGGQRQAQRELGWNRATIRKGTHELRSGVTCADAFALRGRKPAEATAVYPDVQFVYAHSQNPGNPAGATAVAEAQAALQQLAAA